MARIFGRLGLLNVRIDTKDSELRDQARKVQSLEDACQDLEGTIVQFRELVLQLQTCVSFPPATSLF